MRTWRDFDESGLDVSIPRSLGGENLTIVQIGEGLELRDASDNVIARTSGSGRSLADYGFRMGAQEIVFRYGLARDE